MSTSTTTNFAGLMGRRLRLWQGGRLAVLLLRLSGWAVVLLAASLLADCVFALDEQVRRWLLYGAPLVLLGAAMPLAVRVLRLTRLDLADMVDQSLGSRRRELRTALELAAPAVRVPEDGVGRYLGELAVTEAASKLQPLRTAQFLPLPGLARQGKVLGLQLAGLLAVMLFCGWPACRVILERLWFPDRDVPPWSRYQFTVTPVCPRILYGGTAEVAVRLAGAPVREQVWLQTRGRDGQVQRTACFQVAEGRFAQRLERVVAPVEFCFATGRARSSWYGVELLLQPRIELARIRVSPPAYTKLPRREFVAGHEELMAHRGTRIELVVSSNRPLRDGSASVVAKGATTGEAVVRGGRAGVRSLVFAWTVEAAATVTVTLRDVEGTPTAEPLVLQQRLLADAAPVGALTEPPVFSLATPGAALRLTGHVEDDLGLARVELVRGLQGFNDRPRALDLVTGERRLDFDVPLDLRAIGVAAGQTLEFYLEAMDTNPWQAGLGQSEVARVQIISDADYAGMLRARITVAEFAARYTVAQAALGQVQAALSALQQAASKASTTPEDFAKALADARAAVAKTLELYRRLGHDFAVFDSEKKLQQNLAELETALAPVAKALEGMRAGGPAVAEQVAALLKGLEAPAEQLEDTVSGAGKMAQVAAVMECGPRFSQLVRRQATVVRRLARFDGHWADADVKLLPGLGDSQDQIRAELEAFMGDMRNTVDALPPECRDLWNDASEFLTRLQGLWVPVDMTAAVTAGRNQDGPGMLRLARVALEKLQQLRSQCSESSFGGLCQDKGEVRFKMPEDWRTTLEQLFAGMQQRAGQERGPGAGRQDGAASGAGNAEAGYSMPGYSALVTPVYGPDRTSLAQPSGSGPGSGRDRSGGAGGGGSRVPMVEQVRGAPGAGPAGRGAQADIVPEKYREAVKRFFTEKPK